MVYIGVIITLGSDGGVDEEPLEFIRALGEHLTKGAVVECELQCVFICASHSLCVYHAYLWAFEKQSARILASIR